jgi:hypothetical protein
MRYHGYMKRFYNKHELIYNYSIYAATRKQLKKTLLICV